MLVSIIWIIVYVVIGTVTVPLVRILGPVGIRNYVLEELYDSDTGYYNVIYRIVSPVVCCTAFVSLCGVVATAAGFPAPTAGFLSVVFYWILLAGMKIAARNVLSLPGFLLEVASSIGIAILFDQLIVHRVLQHDFAFIDDSNIAFQAEMAVLAFAVQSIVSLFVRRRYKISCRTKTIARYGDKNQYLPTSVSSYYSTVDVSEKKLYAYQCKYGSMLPNRFLGDPLLWCVFFSIMAIEDSNRPSAFRFLERIACTLGMAHSTGIMQQKSEKPLSDSESVELAIDYIGRMWDSFLKTFAKSAQGSNSPDVFMFTSSWYKYDYRILADATEKAFGFFYGDYCGTRLLDAGFVFSQVRSFWERDHYGFLPRTVMSSWRTTQIEPVWFGDKKVFWEDDYTVRITDPDNEHHGCLLICDDNTQASKEKVGELCKCIKSNSGEVIKVSLVENVYATIFVHYEKELMDSKLDTGWRIIRTN